MRLRLYHHRDGARVAYRETGTGPGLALLHSLGLSHREWEPVVAALEPRFRVVLPDLPLHGDSEDRPRHPYTLEWMTEVLAGFCDVVLGPRPMLAGHSFAFSPCRDFTYASNSLLAPSPSPVWDRINQM